MKCTLIIESDETKGKSFDFDKDEITIGRIMENDLVVNDRSISRSHAKIIKSGGQFELIDLDSKNGVRLNGEQVKTAKLNNNDTLEIGDVTIKFLCSGVSTSSSADETIVAKLPGKNIDRIVKGSVDRVKDILNKEEIKGAFQKPPIEIPEGIKEKIPPVLKKPIVLAAIGIILLLAVIFTISNDSPDGWGSLKNIPDNSSTPIPLPANGTYGHMKDNDKTHVDKAVFTFNWQKGNAVLNYFIGGTSKGEIDIFLNNQKLDSIPDFSGWLSVKNIRLPQEYLKQGENMLIFDNVLNPPESRPGPGVSETWGVSEINVTIEQHPACNPTLADESYNRAVIKYKEKKIGHRNLYDSMLNYQRALDYAHECEIKPGIFMEAERGLNTTRKELHEEYNARMLAARQAVNMNDYDRMKREMEDIKKIIPDPDDYRYFKADNNLKAFGFK